MLLFIGWTGGVTDIGRETGINEPSSNSLSHKLSWERMKPSLLPPAKAIYPWLLSLGWQPDKEKEIPEFQIAKITRKHSTIFPKKGWQLTVNNINEISWKTLSLTF